LRKAEGVPLPAEWRSEDGTRGSGRAFAYCLRLWCGVTGRMANALSLMFGASAVKFAISLSPCIAATVSKQSMSTLLTDGWLIVWSVTVALSTILIIASMGYA
jgi:hypothetical protein